MALQQLYAFYIAKQANQDWAQQQLSALLTPDVWATDVPTSTQLAQDRARAQALLAEQCENSGYAVDASAAHPATQDHVSAAVQQAFASYKQAMARDSACLQQALQQAVQQLDQAYARVLQLLVLWAHIAERQADRSKAVHTTTAELVVVLHQNAILQQLKTSQSWKEYVQVHTAGWEQDYELVEDWYRQFVKKAPAVQHLIEASPQQQLTYLLNKVIWQQDAIQAFFEHAYLNWPVYKHVVKRRIQDVLKKASQYSEKDTKLWWASTGASCGDNTLQSFYTDLVTWASTRDKELEALIARSVQNWDVDRLVLTDRIIVKLALCEMLYIEDIPSRVTINEYIEISKMYSTPKSSQFVNGLLDAVASTLENKPT